MKTQVIATIGPSSFSLSILKKMKEAGFSIGRINTKYGDEKQWSSIMGKLKKLGIKIMIDIKSLEKINWVNLQKIDYLAISYAQNARQINKIRSLVEDRSVEIVSKIETKNGLKNIDKIIRVSDGVMIARGDLSRNTSFEKVPYYKKLIIDKCNSKERFVIIATEMLMSMTKSKVATNAEVEDVFSAVVGGGDCLMLSEETAIGTYPVLCVQTMNKIIHNAEKYLRRKV